MRLTRSKLNSAGIVRKRRGKSFAFYGPDGSLLSDADTAQRINDLVIPPAWKNVWISPKPNGHIQAVGTDAAGRRQYLYHVKWQEERAEEKFDRVVELSTRLPEGRAQIAKDLKRRGLTRERVLALALQLLDRGYFRAGGEQSAEEFEHYGLATLLCQHVSFRSGAVVFDYPAKSGVQRNLEVDDPDVVRTIRALMRQEGRPDRLLVCRSNSEESWVDLRADDINARFKELVGAEYTVKDLRTWHGTVLAAAAFADAKPPTSKTAATRAAAGVMKEVSSELGNTPAVARASYVDPRVLNGYLQGRTIASAVKRAERASPADKAQAILETATRNLIRRMARS